MPRRLPDCCPSTGFETGLHDETFQRARCWLLPLKRGVLWKTGKQVFKKAGDVYLRAHEAAASLMKKGFLTRVTVCHSGCPTGRTPKKKRTKRMQYCLYVRAKPQREDIGEPQTRVAEELRPRTQFKW